MKNRKHLFALPLMILALGSCGTHEESKPSIDIGSNGEVNFQDVELNVWSIIGDPDQTYLDKVNRAFNDLYSGQIKANIRSLGTSTFYTSLANTIQSDPESAPDVIIYHSERLTSMIDNNIIIPLNDYFQYTGLSFDKEEYLSNVISECYGKGKNENQLYGIPLDVHAGVWYTRNDILEKNGFSKPTNLQEFKDVCNGLIRLNNEGKMWHRAMNKNKPNACEWTQLKLNNFNPVCMYSGDNIESGWIPQTAVFQNGGELTTSDGRPAWNTDGLKTTIQMFRNWQTGEGYEGKFVAAGLDSQSIWTNFAAGNAVFTCEGPWWAEERLNEYEEVLADKKDENGKTYKPVDILNMSKLYAQDASKDYAKSIYGVGHCFSITRTCSSDVKKAAGLLYSQYMTTHAVEYMQGGHLPASKTVLNSEQYKTSSFYERYLKEFGDPSSFKMLGRTPYYEEVYVGLKKVYQDVFSPLYNSQSVNQIITARYQEAMDAIDSKEGL